MSAQVSGCVYCGLPRASLRRGPRSVVRLPTCVSHADLLELDPFYAFDSAIAAVEGPLLALPSPGAARELPPRPVAALAMPP